MNPYDFARIDWNRFPERRRPVWHHRLVGEGAQHLYTGHLEGDIFVETPLFIADPRSNSSDPRKAAQSIKNAQGEYIIPGSSLKGMIRNVVETLGNGCLTLFDGSYERGRVNYRGGETPKEFQHCNDNTKLCIACRTFGMLKERAQGIFLGKVNIGDVCSYSDKNYLYDPIYTLALMEPKPHHASFYLDEGRQHIAGRKFYFHHAPDQGPVTENRIIMMNGRPANRYIQPLDRDTQFHMRIDFTNLEADEFAALLLAITLEKDMRHKIGYGKPMGLGSIYLAPTRLKLVDYAARYTTSGNTRGITLYEGDTLWPFIDSQLDPFYEKHLLKVAMDDLRRIWRWPPDPAVEYYYPSKRDWFDTEDSIGKRIADTRNVL
jgi:CRISPR/Cas system CSM-associated protein Csm3 (group 7 of RAMP superfamily)